MAGDAVPPELSAPPQTLEQLQAHLRDHFMQLSAQLQGGARYLLDHPQEIPLASMRKIAAHAGVQPTTLVRLSQLLGFDGWQGLRELFVDAYRGGPQPYAKKAKRVVRENASQHMVAEMFQAQQANLAATEARGADALARAADLLAAAPNVFVAGFRACFPIAFTFHYVYRLFRPTVHLVRGDAGTLEMELRAIAPKDAVIVASFAPYSQEIIRVARAAHEAGCRVVALTDSSVAPIALEADVTVLFSLESPSFFPSVACGVAVAETLVEMLLARSGQSAIRALEIAEGQLHRTGAYVKAQRQE